MGLRSLTVGSLEALEVSVGRPLTAMDGMSDLLAMLHAVAGENAGTIRLADAEDVLVAEAPVGVAARYLTVFGCEPWCWPPSVTRRERIIDLDQIIARAKEMAAATKKGSP